MRVVILVFVLVVMPISLTRASERNHNHEKALRDVQNVIFEGVESFDVDDIRRALDDCRNLRKATDLENSIVHYVVVLKRSVAAGYAHAGFLEACVHGRLDEAGTKVVVSVQEGRSYRGGAVRVTGLATPATEELEKALTEPFAPLTAAEVTVRHSDGVVSTIWMEPSTDRARMGDPVWKCNAPVAGDAIALDAIRQRVEEHFQACGRESAEFEVHVEPRSDGDLADLIVAVEDPGLPIVVDKIIVEGSRRNSRKDILKYLGIQPGMASNARLAPRLQRRLQESGRFLSANVTSGIAIRDEDRADCGLIITVKEHARLPTLSESLTPEEVTLLKMANWLANWTEGGASEDLVIKLHRRKGGIHLVTEFPECNLEGVLSPTNGTILNLNARTNDGKSIVQTLMLGAGRTALHSSRNRLEFPPGTNLFKWTGTLTIRAGAPRENDPNDVQTETQFGGGLSRADGDFSSPCQLRLAIDPALLLLRLRQKTLQSVRNRGRMQYRNDEVEFLVDERTGRIEKVDATNVIPGFDTEIRFEQDAFRPELTERDRAMATTPNAFDASRRLQSALIYFLDEYRQYAGAALPAADVESLGALRKVFANWLPARGGEASLSQTFDEAARIAFRVPALASLNENESTFSRLGEFGPIRLLACAFIFNKIGHNASIKLAEAGLGRLTLSAFQRDYMSILNSRQDGPYFASIGKAIQALEPAEIGALTRLVPVEWGQQQLRRCLELLAKERDKSVVEVLPSILDDLWTACLKERFEESLRSLAEPARGKPHG